ncbi:MAG: DcaP family trimeric outer membrane transporter [Pirellula sp.]
MTIQFIQHRLFVCFVMATCLVMQARAQSLELEGSSSELQSTKAKIDTLGLADTASDGSFLLGSPSTSPSGLVSSRLSESDALSSGLNFNQFPSDFGNGLTLSQDRWGVKFGGYVKADLIHDFHAIDSNDFFDPATIPVGEPDRTDSHFHVRQTRLNMDARWITDQGDPLRLMVEGDFFGEGNTLRLRHAFGEYQSFIIGQTWTTFTHRAALPNTLDVVGDVASVGRRQAQVRFTHHFLEDRLTFAAAIEDSNVRVEEDLLAIGTPRSPLADFICRLRYNGENGQIQLATIFRQLGFQPNQSNVRTGVGTGLNATGYVDLTSRSRTYGGILWGEGIGNYRDLPDIALTSATSAVALESLAWYAGVHHQWAKNWSSNLTYSQGNIDNTPNQAASSVRRLQYCAVNLIWQPTPYTFAGTEYLWGERMNLDSHSDDANRVMISFGFLLP